MPAPGNCLRRENGNAVLTVMMILSILTVLGFSAMNTSNTEIMVAANDVSHRINFYDAESGVVQIVNGLDIASDDDLYAHSLPGLYALGDASLWTPVNPGGAHETWGSGDALEIMRNMDNWDPDPGAPANPVNTGRVFPEDGGTTRRLAIDMGIAAGSSMLMTNGSTVRSYASFGYHKSSAGRILIEVGYKKRF